MKGLSQMGEEDAMAAMPACELPSHDELLDIYEHLELPEGYRAEIVEGVLTVSPVAGGPHPGIVWYLMYTFHREGPEDLAAMENLEVRMPAGNRFIPDVTVIPRKMRTETQGSVAADVVQLVAEVVSPSNSENDRVRKLNAYARAGIPFYLLIDPLISMTTLFSEPKDGIYSESLPVPFDGIVELPPPFNLTLDTSEYM